ncbi:MAG: LysM peptidoglycan-binding domain-containing protein [Bacteroidales bacterium]|nr:LysM peptidoglycan-binding domain-containing protein [Bacteroidales bacterium]MCK9498739.1 LysM peptidoglycan-binding domain-containing protein [Bacteroidales bacterium]NLB87477.1 LysM peptidoglycan-binding domain-containing protein [Bacteroidales bacterium]
MKKVFCTSFLVILFSSILFAQIEVEISTEKTIIDDEKFYIHTVAEGNTVYSICKAYGINEDLLYRNNPQLSNANIKIGQILQIPVINELTADGKHIIYTVKPGDTLYSLCRKYGISEVDFYTINPNIKQGKALKVGQEIMFPYNLIDSKVHEPDKDTINFIYHLVEKGETIYGISRKYNVSKEDLIKLNPEIENNRLLIGEVVKIPKRFEEEKDEEANEEVFISETDSIDFTNIDFTNDENWYSFENKVEISILLPFEINDNLRNLYRQETGKKEQRLNLITEKIISFYSGILLGLEKLENNNVDIEVKVYDIGKDNSVISNLLKDGKIKSTDIIIGPAFKSQVDYLNENLSDSKPYILLPFVNQTEVLVDNSKNIILKPSADAVVNCIASYTLENKENLYLIIQGSTGEQIKLANEQYDAIVSKLGSSKNVKIIKYSGGKLLDLKNLVSKTQENVFILPFHTELICTKIFLDLFPLKDYEITLIGDPCILDYETIDPKYYLSSKFTYFTGININYTDEEVNGFVENYRDVFLSEPDENSFLAYDLINYWVLNYLKYGNNLDRAVLNENVFEGLSGKQVFVSEPHYSKQSFSNSNVYLFKLQEDYSFEQIFSDCED